MAHSAICPVDTMKFFSSLIIFFVVAFATFPTVAIARPTFVQRVPSGTSVQGVRAIGHQNANGGGVLNAFGEAFEASGFQWTTALCQEDSDGDGATNGEELNDPCCTWQPGSALSVVAPATHPGVANSFSASDLAAMRCPASAGATASSVGETTPSVTPVSPPAATEPAPVSEPSIDEIVPLIVAAGSSASGTAEPLKSPEPPAQSPTTEKKGMASEKPAATASGTPRALLAPTICMALVVAVMVL